MLLFNTGQSDIIKRNAQTLGIDLRDVDTIVLSHGHYDHTGGLMTVLDEAKSVNLYPHPQTAKPKFACYKDKPFRNYHLQQIALADCTGDNAVGKFRKALGQRCFSCSVGLKNNYF